jgi:hypothetical protein
MDPNTQRLFEAAAGAGGEVLGIEDVFSTWLYTGNGSTQTITNGIDLAGEGGLVWIKNRAAGVNASNALFDTERGTNKVLSSNRTGQENELGVPSDTLTAFNSNGFSIGADSTVYGWINNNGFAAASWTFRKAEKFFDVVTYTGNGSSTGDSQTINHNLGSTPGFVMIKRRSSTGDWVCWHRSISTGQPRKYIQLNATNPTGNMGVDIWGTFDSSVITVKHNGTVGDSFEINKSGETYVAYVFAHDAGGFGDDGTESVIKCGSFTTNGSGYIPEVDLGWEPQFLLYKASSTTGNWEIADTQRRWNVSLGSDGGNYNSLYPNLSSAENAGAAGPVLKSTGFGSPGAINFGANKTYIYIAIRRGPMKTPTDATEVFNVAVRAGDGAVTAGFPVDLTLSSLQGVSSSFPVSAQRLTGPNYLNTSGTGAEGVGGGGSPIYWSWDSNTSVTTTSFFGANSNVRWMFRRAPGFVDVVGYTGTGSARTVNHNLGVVPELIFIKSRSAGYDWAVYAASETATDRAFLNLDFAFSPNSTTWNNTSPTNSVFTVGTDNDTNSSSVTYIAYLFATVPGVSKVGSYTGTGTTLDVDCGFAAGARFVLIKRTDSTGDWYVWDSARGITSGNDPYLLLNSTAAEVTDTNYIDTLSSGFQITSSAPAAINASGGSFIFLAVA